MKTCARLFGFIFVVLFILSGPVALILFNVDTYLLSADPYIQSLDEDVFREQLPGVIAEQIQHSLVYNPCLEDPDQCEGSGPAEPGNGPPAYLGALNQDQWQRIFNELLDPVWMQDQVEIVLQGVFHNLEPGVTPVPIRVSLTEVKARLAGTPGMALARDMLAAQPPCSAEQVQSLYAQLGVETNIDDLLACNPPADMMAAIEPELNKALAQAAAGLPEKLQLEAIDELMQFNRVSVGDQRGPDLATVRRVMRYSPIIPLSFLLLVILFAVRSFYDFGRWVGLPIFLIGLGMAAVMFLTPGMLNWAIDQFLIPKLPGMLSTATSDFMLEFLRSVGNSTASRIGLHAVLMLLVGGALLLISSLTHRRRSVDSIPPLTKPRGDRNEGA